ncbi:MAG: NADH-quinone oxidoreductase subunit J [bacterium]
MELFLFYLLSIVALACSLGMILQRQMVYSVGLMIIVLLCLAGLYLTLKAPFLAMVQIIVYAGAVMVLFVFTSMMIGQQEISELSTTDPGLWIAMGIGTVFILDIWVLTLKMPTPFQMPGHMERQLRGGHPVQYLGEMLFNNYIVALQLVALIILVAIVGAIYLSRIPEPVEKTSRGMVDTTETDEGEI